MRTDIIISFLLSRSGWGFDRVDVPPYRVLVRAWCRSEAHPAYTTLKPPFFSLEISNMQ